jgi:hypothetical protein
MTARNPAVTVTYLHWLADLRADWYTRFRGDATPQRLILARAEEHAVEQLILKGDGSTSVPRGVIEA